MVLTLIFAWSGAEAYATQFNQAYTVTYTFDIRGNATVTKKVSLTNLNENIYPSEYNLDIPEDATNIAAFDDTGKLEVQIGHKGDKKLAKLILNSQNIGIRNNTELALVYETRALVKNEGKRKLIRIPPVLSSEAVGSATIYVELPDAWGTPDIVDPIPETPSVWKDNEVQDGIQIFYIPDPPTNTPPPPTPTSQATGIAKTITPFLGLLVGICIIGISVLAARLMHKP